MFLTIDGCEKVKNEVRIKGGEKKMVSRAPNLLINTLSSDGESLAYISGNCRRRQLGYYCREQSDPAT